MYKALSPGAIGVTAATIDAGIAAAKQGGFGGVEFSAAQAADAGDEAGTQSLRDKFANAAILPAGFGLPVDWRGDESAWRSGLENLPRLARAAADIGGGRTMTWI